LLKVEKEIETSSPETAEAQADHAS